MDSHAISMIAPMAPMAISFTMATPIHPATIADTLAACKIVLARGVALRRHAITGPTIIMVGESIAIAAAHASTTDTQTLLEQSA